MRIREIYCSPGTVDTPQASAFSAFSVLSSSEEIEDAFYGSTAYFLSNQGTVFALGLGANGSCGNGTVDNNSTAKPVLGLEKEFITKVYPRENGAYALSSSGELFSWGMGESGQNGNGVFEDSLTAVKVALPENSPLREIIPRPEGAYIILENGEVYSWGNGSSGVNGTDTGTSNLGVPEKIYGLDGIEIKEIEFRKIQQDGAYALSSSGEVYSWGRGGQGANGNDSTSIAYSVVKVIGLEEVFVEKVVSRRDGAYALSSSGEVYSWGRGSGLQGSGANGNGLSQQERTAVKVIGLEEVFVENIKSREYGAYALSSSGEVYSWGSGDYGSNGQGDESAYNSAVKVIGLEEVDIKETVYRDERGAYFLSETGNVYALGYGGLGSAGNGSTDNNTVAARVLGLDDVFVEKIFSESVFNAFVLSSEKEPWGWGNERSGAMGNGNTSTSGSVSIAEKTPVLPEPIVSIAPRDRNGGYALGESGKVYSWGVGINGENGDGESTRNEWPVEVIFEMPEPDPEEPIVVLPEEPTRVDNTVIIPEVDGVEYSEYGTVAIPESGITITAVPEEGYVFPEGTVTDWFFEYEFPEPIEVTPEEPVRIDNTVTIPEVEGVVYVVDGTIVTGNIDVQEEGLTITASPEDDYTFPDGTVTEWFFEYEFPEPIVVFPEEPTRVDNTVIIPEVDGVEYSEYGTVAIPESGITITASPQEGYVFPEDAITVWLFEYEFPEPIEVTPAPPVFTDDFENGGGTFTTVYTEGVIYVPAEGTAEPGETIVITATPEDGYTLVGTTEWSHVFPEKPVDPDPEPPVQRPILVLEQEIIKYLRTEGFNASHASPVSPTEITDDYVVVNRISGGETLVQARWTSATIYIDCHIENPEVTGRDRYDAARLAYNVVESLKSFMKEKTWARKLEGVSVTDSSFGDYTYYTVSATLSHNYL